MKKAILLAGLLLIGVACSKNDDNKPAGKEDGKVEKPDDKGKDKDKPTPSPSPSPAPSPEPSPSPSPAPWEVDPVFPKKVKTGDRNYYGLDTYFFENGKVVKIERETYDRGQKVEGELETTTVTYAGKKYPSAVVYSSKYYNIRVEYTYNDRNQVLTVKKTENGITKTKTFEYDASGRVVKESNPDVTYVYTYPDDKTVVRTEALSSGGSNITTYTIEGGNLVKEVLQLKNADGQVERTVLTVYEYDLSIKNPNLSIETKLVKSYFYENKTYSPETVSKNVLTKWTTTSPVHGENRSVVFTYQKNDQGYPTEVDERTSGNTRSWTAYEY